MAALERREPGELDDEAPLLDVSGPSLGPRAARLCRKAQVALLKWWAITSDADFLESAVSRRGTWGVVMPMTAGLVGVVPDLCSGVPWQVLTVDAAACVFALFLGWLPQRSLWSDVAVECWVTLWTLAYGLAWRMEGSNREGTELVAAASMLDLIVLYCCGLHSGAMASCTVALTLVYAVAINPGEALMVLVVGAVVTVGSAFHTYHSAELFQQVQVQLLATKELLDSAGDGFCSLDTTSRCITHASPKLQSTFATDRLLEAVCFDELIMPADLERFRALFAAAEAGSALSPVLVTCRSPSCAGGEGEASPVTFDAKLLPHLACTGEFSLCVQVQGEVRRGLAEPTPVPPSPSQGLRSLSLTASTFVSHALSRRSEHTVRRGLRISASTQTAALPPQLPRAEEGSAATPLALRMFRMRLKSRQRLLPRFRETPARTLEQVVFTAMRSVNPRGSGCCAWHVLSLVLMREARKQLLQRCRPQFSPKQGFQCQRCHAMNEVAPNEAGEEDDELECSVCFAPCQLPARGSGYDVPSSGASAADDEEEES